MKCNHIGDVDAPLLTKSRNVDISTWTLCPKTAGGTACGLQVIYFLPQGKYMETRMNTQVGAC